MMTDREIHRLVEDYIGTDRGYLCGFTYSKHNNFYVQYCDMDVDVPSYRARGLTTRRAFIAILKDSKASCYRSLSNHPAGMAAPWSPSPLSDRTAHVVPCDAGPVSSKSTPSKFPVVRVCMRARL